MRIFSRELQAANLGLFFLVATDLIVAAAQDIITSPGKVSTENLKKLSAALTDKNTTRTSLLNLLIDVVSSTSNGR